MVSLDRLYSEGVIPQDAQAGGKVWKGDYYVCYFGEILSTEIGDHGTFTKNDFRHIYLQIETGSENGDDFERIAVKLNCNSDLTGLHYEKESVRCARKRIQDHFAKKVPAFERTRFQFASPKEDRSHASWLTVGRIRYDSDTYKHRISAVRKAFEELKTDFCG